MPAHVISENDNWGQPGLPKRSRPPRGRVPRRHIDHIPIHARHFGTMVSDDDLADHDLRRHLLRQARQGTREQSLEALAELREKYRLRLPLVEASWGLGELTS